MYAEFCLKTNVLLLFESFQKACLAIYNLDPADMSPGLSFDAILTLSEVELEQTLICTFLLNQVYELEFRHAKTVIGKQTIRI